MKKGTAAASFSRQALPCHTLHSLGGAPRLGGDAYEIHDYRPHTQQASSPPLRYSLPPASARLVVIISYRRKLRHRLLPILASWRIAPYWRLSYQPQHVTIRQRMMDDVLKVLRFDIRRCIISHSYADDDIDAIYDDTGILLYTYAPPPHYFVLEIGRFLCLQE